jgi:hypothetical protein
MEGEDFGSKTTVARVLNFRHAWQSAGLSSAPILAASPTLPLHVRDIIGSMT